MSNDYLHPIIDPHNPAGEKIQEEKHFLEHIVADEEREQVKPWYNAEGDCIIYQVADEAVVAENPFEKLKVESGKKGVISIQQPVFSRRGGAGTEY